MRNRPDWSSCIRQLERKGMTQRQIAKKAGIAVGTVNRLRNDPTYCPSWDKGTAVLMCLGEI